MLDDTVAQTCPERHGPIEIDAVARALGIDTRYLDARHTSEVASALQSGFEDHVDGLLARSPVTYLTRSDIVDFAGVHDQPVIYSDRVYGDIGGLVYYGLDLRALSYRSAYYVDRILRGTKPADLPVEGPTVIELIVNTSVLGVLGLTVPSDVVAQVTEWVQ
jgi:putative tryptophan/tyrosine transport system substrate-binding protein